VIEVDWDKGDEAVPVLLSLTLHERNEFGGRAWKGHDWEALNRLHAKGLIGDPRSKARSVVLSPGTVRQSEQAFAAAQDLHEQAVGATGQDQYDLAEAAAQHEMKANKAQVMFVAKDAGDATRKKYIANASRKNLHVVDSYDGATIGGWSGRDFVAVMTLGGRLAKSAFRDVESLERLGRVEG